MVLENRAKKEETARTAAKTRKLQKLPVLPLSSPHTLHTQSRELLPVAPQKLEFIKKRFVRFPLTQIHIEIGLRMNEFRLQIKFYIINKQFSVEC